MTGATVLTETLTAAPRESHDHELVDLLLDLADGRGVLR